MTPTTSKNLAADATTPQSADRDIAPDARVAAPDITTEAHCLERGTASLGSLLGNIADAGRNESTDAAELRRHVLGLASAAQAITNEMASSVRGIYAKCHQHGGAPDLVPSQVVITGRVGARRFAADLNAAPLPADRPVDEFAYVAPDLCLDEALKVVQRQVHSLWALFYELAGGDDVHTSRNVDAECSPSDRPKAMARAGLTIAKQVHAHVAHLVSETGDDALAAHLVRRYEWTVIPARDA